MIRDVTALSGAPFKLTQIFQQGCLPSGRRSDPAGEALGSEPVTRNAERHIRRDVSGRVLPSGTVFRVHFLTSSRRFPLTLVMRLVEHSSAIANV